MPKLQQVKDRYFITMPKEIVDKKEWKKGQKLFFVFNERGEVAIKD